MKALLVYLIIINAVGLVLMLVDKHRARNNLWRIPERSLLLTAAIGGSVGVIAGMYLFRHKTKHLKFTLGVPAILCGHVLLAVLLFVYLF